MAWISVQITLITTAITKENEPHGGRQVRLSLDKTVLQNTKRPPFHHVKKLPQKPLPNSASRENQLIQWKYWEKREAASQLNNTFKREGSCIWYANTGCRGRDDNRVKRKSAQGRWWACYWSIDSTTTGRIHI